MSSAAATLEGAASFGASEDASVATTLTLELKARLLKFLNELPDHHEDIDPDFFRRLPIPY
jgi:hypothetical protein